MASVHNCHIALYIVHLSEVDRCGRFTLASHAFFMAHRRQPRPPHLSRISLHFGCILQTIAFSKASHDRPVDVVICESRCMDSLQSNVIRLTGCGGGMCNLINLFPTSFKP